MNTTLASYKPTYIYLICKCYCPRFGTYIDLDLNLNVWILYAYIWI